MLAATVKNGSSTKWSLDCCRNDDDSFATALEDVLADGMKRQIAKASAAIPDTVRNAVDQLFLTFTLSAQGGMLTMVCHEVEYVILDRIRRAVLGEKIGKSIDKYFEAGKAPKNFARGCFASTGSSQ